MVFVHIGIVIDRAYLYTFAHQLVMQVRGPWGLGIPAPPWLGNQGGLRGVKAWKGPKADRSSLNTDN